MTTTFTVTLEVDDMSPQSLLIIAEEMQIDLEADGYEVTKVDSWSRPSTLVQPTILQPLPPSQ